MFSCEIRRKCLQRVPYCTMPAITCATISIRPSITGEVDGDVPFRAWLNDAFPAQSEVAWSTFWSRVEGDIRHVSLGPRVQREHLSV
jgi:hypothetical protein